MNIVELESKFPSITTVKWRLYGSLDGEEYFKIGDSCDTKEEVLESIDKPFKRSLENYKELHWVKEQKLIIKTVEPFSN